ncbi:SRPBCC family protein [Niallia nealsonii]|uniref:SRPBCC domain-containing protein n=1 Tax=Niallia nealsonii TaxID=115979 RepID=A0A2N0Z7U4_9BACI|nr:SRPBCC domain-containing protein [Niallia nealsonii]PKG25578.1 SRPBCC domain-containing protein [Niallia nealsonii]
MSEKVQDIVQKIVINASIEKVWKKAATSEGIAAWFMPNDFQLEEGHKFHLHGPFGPSPCKVIEVDPPKKLTFTWDLDGWIVSFLLTELENNRTEFTVIHGGWKESDKTVEKANEKASVIRDRMNGGWEQIVAKLKAAIESNG